MKKTFLLIFICVALLELVGVVLDDASIKMFAKPFLVLSLISYYQYSMEKPSLTFTAALFFCWVGDVMLMFQEKSSIFFMLGLAGFLIGHLFFILAYRKARTDESDDSLLGTQKARFAFPIILAGSGLVVTLYPSLGDMKIPVLLYALVITIMTLNASFRYGRTSKRSYWLVFIGAFLFMVSDTILALNKFQAPFPHAELYIMSTYMLAQFAIVEGIVQHSALTK